MTRLYIDSLRDILNAIIKAQMFVDGLDFEQFESNDEKAFAVIRALEIIGEATKKIPETERAKYPQIPWKAIAGMRDKLIHGYYIVNLARVWATVQRDLPPLYDTVSQMLDDLV